MAESKNTFTVNHPISGQQFVFDSKAAADKYANEVLEATGYQIQITPDAPYVEPEPTVTPDSPSAQVK